MSNIALQIERISAGSVNNGQNVIFETVVHSSGNIDYDNTTGEITIDEIGSYEINWWVVTQASQSPTGPVFAISTSQGDFLEGNSPTKVGQISGVGIIDVSTTPFTVSLINSSSAPFYFASGLPITATLVISKAEAAVVNSGCYAVDQLANILSQMIEAYSDTTWTVFSNSLSSFLGMPLELYTAPNANGPGILRLVDVNENYEALPLINITAIYPGDGTVFDPSFTFLPTPDPLPQDCEADMLAAMQSYLPIDTPVTINLGPAIVATGTIYRNEYGVIVLSDEEGNTPIFLATPHILRVLTSPTPQIISNPLNIGKKPSITIVKE